MAQARVIGLVVVALQAAKALSGRQALKAWVGTLEALTYRVAQGSMRQGDWVIKPVCALSDAGAFQETAALARCAQTCHLASQAGLIARTADS